MQLVREKTRNFCSIVVSAVLLGACFKVNKWYGYSIIALALVNPDETCFQNIKKLEEWTTQRCLSCIQYHSHRKTWSFTQKSVELSQS